MLNGLTWAYKLLGPPCSWKSIIACDIEWFKEVIAATLTVLAVSEGFRVFIVDEESLFRVEILENVSKSLNVDVNGKVILVTKVERLPHIGNMVIILLNPKRPYSLLKLLRDRPYIMLHYKRHVKHVRLEKVYCQRLQGKLFVLKRGELKVKVEAGAYGVYDTSLKPRGILKTVLNLIQEALVEYGPLTVSDAVTVIAGALKVSRSQARSILYKLASSGFIKIENKNVLIA